MLLEIEDVWLRVLIMYPPYVCIYFYIHICLTSLTPMQNRPWIICHFIIHHIYIYRCNTSKMNWLQLSIQFKPLAYFSPVFVPQHLRNIEVSSGNQQNKKHHHDERIPSTSPGEQIFRKLRRKGQGQATRSACQQSAQHLCISRFEANMPWNESRIQ